MSSPFPPGADWTSHLGKVWRRLGCCCWWNCWYSWYCIYAHTAEAGANIKTLISFLFTTSSLWNSCILVANLISSESVWDQLLGVASIRSLGVHWFMQCFFLRWIIFASHCHLKACYHALFHRNDKNSVLNISHNRNTQKIYNSDQYKQFLV